MVSFTEAVEGKGKGDEEGEGGEGGEEVNTGKKLFPITHITHITLITPITLISHIFPITSTPSVRASIRVGSDSVEKILANFKKEFSFYFR